MRHIFDPEVVAPPCRYPCDLPWHVHDEDLPTNLPNRADTSPEQDSLK